MKPYKKERDEKRAAEDFIDALMADAAIKVKDREEALTVHEERQRQIYDAD